MPPIDLHKIFGLKQKQTYWNIPLNPDECYVSEISVDNLPSRLDTQKITDRFLKLLFDSGVRLSVAADATSDGSDPANNKGILFAFDGYVTAARTVLLEKAINAEIRNHGLFANYTVSMSANEIYKLAMNERDDPSQGLEPS